MFPPSQGRCMQLENVSSRVWMCVCVLAPNLKQVYGSGPSTGAWEGACEQRLAASVSSACFPVPRHEKAMCLSFALSLPGCVDGTFELRIPLEVLASKCVTAYVS